MSTETLNQTNQVPGSFVPPISTVLPVPTHNQNGVLRRLVISFDPGNLNGPKTLKFLEWSSTAVVTNLTTSGNFQGFPTGYHMDFHGTGNITGNGNDDAYTGSLDGTLNYSTVEGKLECLFHTLTASISYTD